MYAKALSSILGITLERTGDESSKHGFVLTSMSQGRNSESIITSNPNTQKLLPFLLGSMMQ